MAGKSIKETIRAAFVSGKPMKKSEPQDPFFIGEESKDGMNDMLGEMTQNEDEIDFADLEKNTEDDKSGPEHKGTAKGITEGTEKEAPPPEIPAADTSDANKGTGTDALAIGTGEASDTPPAAAATPGGAKQLYKVRTVDGDEELTLEELIAGNMMKKHYAQSQQMLHEKERRISEMLSNPELLVEYATRNGVNLKPFFKLEMSTEKIEIPPLKDYATDEEKRAHTIMTMLADQNNEMAKKIGSIENNFQRSMKDSQWNSVNGEFETERGDLPKIATSAAMIFFREGQRQYGNKYTMRQAVKDFRQSEGDIVQRAFDSAEGKKRIEAIKTQAITEYSKTKQQHEKESVAGDILPATKVRPNSEDKPKFRNAHEGAEAAKRKFGIFNR